ARSCPARSLPGQGHATSRRSSGSPAAASDAISTTTWSAPDMDLRFAVNVRPKDGILDPQGRAVEGSLGHLGIGGVSDVRVGRRVELRVSADSEAGARAIVERLAGELLSNPLI